MSTKFNQFINRVLSHEGGYVNHPKDPGGETNWGITKRTAQANGYNGSMRAMTREQAIGIYRKAFWERYRADQMPEAVAFQFFDACVNHGYGNAARMLRRASGLLYQAGYVHLFRQGLGTPCGAKPDSRRRRQCRLRSKPCQKSPFSP